MANSRLIARLDIKGPNLIKGIHLEGVRVVGNPSEFARRYYAEGADELLYIDAVASLYGRNSLDEFVRYAAEHVFIPITVGGGVRSAGDVEGLLRAGADKIAVNTAAVQRPDLINEISRRFGTQCMVLQVDAKSVGTGKWEVYVDGGREKTGKDVGAWVREGIDRGAGEILLTSVDQEGTRKGMDISLIQSVTQSSRVPVIASGGVGTPQHVAAAFIEGGASAVAMADILHYKRATFADIRNVVTEAGVKLRKVVSA